MPYKTLEEIESIEKQMLTPAEVALVLGSDPQTIRWQARHEPKKLGFPVIVLKSRVKIPKVGFLNYCRGIKNIVQHEKDIG